MTMRYEWMQARATVAYPTMPTADEQPLEDGEIVVGITEGGDFELLLRGTPKAVAALAELLHHVAARATRVHAEHEHRPGVPTRPPAEVHTYCLDCGKVLA